MKKYVDFNGRARRTEYWMFFLFNLIFGFGALVLDMLLGSVSEGLMFGSFYGLFSLAMIPFLAVTVRRLHDVGKSGWWILISLIPSLAASGYSSSPSPTASGVRIPTVPAPK